MLLMQNVEVQVPGTNYAIEYAITQGGEEEEPGGVIEYGISCKLFEKEKLIDSEMVNYVTSEKARVEKFLCIFEKNQVFPVHIREILEDLLILEFEEKEYKLLI